jgi:hypothetical protein
MIGALSASGERALKDLLRADAGGMARRRAEEIQPMRRTNSPSANRDPLSIRRAVARHQRETRPWFRRDPRMIQLSLKLYF